MASPPTHISWIGYDVILTLILAVFICAPLMKVMVYFANHASVTSTTEYICCFLPVSLFAGWAICATFVNFSSVLLELGLADFKITNDNQTGVIVYAAIVGVLLLAVVVYLRGNVAFSFVCLWAYFWIAVGSFTAKFSALGILAIIFCLVFICAECIVQYRTKRNHFAVTSQDYSRQPE